MKRALIDVNESRVCEVVTPGREFEVAAPLFWTDADDTATPETHYFDGIAVQEKPALVIPRLLTPRQFRLRFTTAEQAAIMTTAMTDADVMAWRMAAAEAQEIDLDHADTVSGMDFLEGKSLVTAARKLEILA